MNLSGFIHVHMPSDSTHWYKNELLNCPLFMPLESKMIVMSCKSCTIYPVVSPGVFQLCSLRAFIQNNCIITVYLSAVSN